MSKHEYERPDSTFPNARAPVKSIGHSTIPGAWLEPKTPLLCYTEQTMGCPPYMDVATIVDPDTGAPDERLAPAGALELLR